MARRRGRSWEWGFDSWERRVPEPPPRRAELEEELGRAPAPVRAEGRELSSTFWGRAWCSNLQRYQDFSNRLPRGRTYLRKGAVLDLAIARGRITALVMGTSLYRVEIGIAAVGAGRWSALRGRCAGKLSSLIELLEGRLGDDVMAAVTDPKRGLFPEPHEIELRCSCPDWATMCKHVAAVLYGVGVRLDEQPRLMFELRGVDPAQLVGAPQRIVGEVDGGRRLDGGLSEIFGVAIEEGTPVAAKPARGAAKERATAKVAAREAKTRVAAAARAKPVVAAKAPAGGQRRKAAAHGVMTRKQLLARGLPASTLQGWLRRRILVPTDEPGVYALTDEARTCLAWYG